MKDILCKPYHGLDSLDIYKHFINDSQLIDLYYDILMEGYFKYFGKNGEIFVNHHKVKMYKWSKEYYLDNVKKDVLSLRETAVNLKIKSNYFNNFRTLNYENTLKILDNKILNGNVLDFGSGDNLLGKVLLGLSSNIRKVYGTDINKNNNTQTSECLEFRLQDSPSIIPIDRNEIDVAISRYTLHHTSILNQKKIGQEIYRILKPNGYFIVIENSFTLNDTYNPQCNDKLLKRFIELKSKRKMNLLIAALDIFSHCFKNKDIDFPFTYKTIDEWCGFYKDRFDIVDISYLGMPFVDLHQAPMTIITFKKRNADAQ